MAGFRYHMWDGWLLLLQMITLQCLHYVFLGIFVTIISHTLSLRPGLDYIFSDVVSKQPNGKPKERMGEVEEVG